MKYQKNHKTCYFNISEKLCFWRGHMKKKNEGHVGFEPTTCWSLGVRRMCKPLNLG